MNAPAGFVVDGAAPRHFEDDASPPATRRLVATARLLLVALYDAKARRPEHFYVVAENGR
jgi:hypothetical protein